MTLKDFIQPTHSTTPSCITLPKNTLNFFVNHGMISVIPQFHDMDFKSPYQHFTNFELTCAIFISRTNTGEYVRLHLFPCSLKDKRKLWFNQLRAHSITTWAIMQYELLQKFFPF